MNTIQSDFREVGEDFLAHYGVAGMKWGQRNARNTPIEGVSSKTNKEAKKDAEEFTRAKLFYGEGAGTRRKLIKAKVESKAKANPSYKKAFDIHVEGTDLGKRASQAKSQRKRKDVVASTKKTARGVNHMIRGNPQYASAASAMLVGGALYIHKKGIDKVVLDHAQTLLKNINR